MSIKKPGPKEQAARTLASHSTNYACFRRTLVAILCMGWLWIGLVILNALTDGVAAIHGRAMPQYPWILGAVIVFYVIDCIWLGRYLRKRS